MNNDNMFDFIVSLFTFSSCYNKKLFSTYLVYFFKLIIPPPDTVRSNQIFILSLLAGGGVHNFDKNLTQHLKPCGKELQRGIQKKSRIKKNNEFNFESVRARKNLH